MSNLCLFCLRGVDLTSSTRRRQSAISSTRDIVELCQLIQHPKFASSISHQNIISQHDGDCCSLCKDCMKLINTAAGIQEQISQLQIQLRKEVVVIRNRILEASADAEDKPYNGGDELDKLMQIRQSLLRLSDEDDSIDDSILAGNVKVKIETEEDDQLLVDAYSPSAFLLHPENDDEGPLFKEEIDELFISPQKKPDSKNRKRGRPLKKTREKVIAAPKSAKRLKKSKQTKIPSSSSQIDDSESENENLPEEEEEEGLIKDNSNDEDDKGKLPAGIKCQHCARKFASKEHLELHVQKFHRYSCYFCENKRFRTVKERNTHSKLEHGRGAKFQCILCSRKFHRMGSLRVHMFMRHETEDKPHACCKCDKHFTLEVNLERHLELHQFENERPLICDLCDARFVDEIRLKQHADTHKPLICEVCQSTFVSKTGLTRHQRIHSKLKPYKCDHCEESFIDNAAKQYHISKVHSTPDQHYLCPICGKSFFNAKILKMHIDRHQGKQNYICEECGEKFSDNGTLKSHKIQKHDGEALICDECGAKFATPKGMKNHKMSHAGLKPFGCNVCDARFLSKWVLANHMRSHSGERPYKCISCDQAFKQKKNLDTHMKSIHSENYVVKTPYACSYCGKEYPRKGILDGHIRQVHTGERPFVCTVCCKGFALKATLTLHLKSHGINNDSSRGQRLPRSKRENFMTTTKTRTPVKKGNQKKLQKNVSPQEDSTSSSSSGSVVMNQSITGLPSSSIPMFPVGQSSGHQTNNNHTSSTINYNAINYTINPSLSHNYYQL